MSDDRTDARGERLLTRRELLKRAGAVGAVVALPVVDLTAAEALAAVPRPAKVVQVPQVPQAREPLETLTAAESDVLEAIVARLIPTDENGPGAAEARAAHYIDRALTGPLASAREAYRAGLAAMDAYAQKTRGAPFARLSPPNQDAVLRDMEQNVATGFTPSSGAFFELLRSHTIQGTFCDPYYGGNANFVGWDLIAYPGVRLAVSVDEQRRLGVDLPANHRSAYDYGAFEKQPPSAGSPGPTP